MGSTDGHPPPGVAVTLPKMMLGSSAVVNIGASVYAKGCSGAGVGASGALRVWRVSGPGALALLAPTARSALGEAPACLVMVGAFVGATMAEVTRVLHVNEDRCRLQKLAQAWRSSWSDCFRGRPLPPVLLLLMLLLTSAVAEGVRRKYVLDMENVRAACCGDLFGQVSLALTMATASCATVTAAVQQDSSALCAPRR